MPIWAVIVLVLVFAVAGWFTGAFMQGAFIYRKLWRRIGERQADYLLRPGDD